MQFIRFKQHTGSICGIFHENQALPHLLAIAKNAIVDFFVPLSQMDSRDFSVCCAVSHWQIYGGFVGASTHKNLIPFNALICCYVPAVAKSVHTSLKTWQ